MNKNLCKLLLVLFLSFGFIGNTANSVFAFDNFGSGGIFDNIDPVAYDSANPINELRLGDFSSSRLDNIDPEPYGGDESELKKSKM